eukprot:g762.t1
MATASSQLCEKLPPNELLEYYKSRIESFETERKELLDKIDALKVDQSEMHKLEWENKQRSGEIWELQKAVSTANNELFEERGRLLKLQTERDELKLQEEEDRKKIQYLLSLARVGEQEITYLRDEQPSTINLCPTQNSNNTQKRTLHCDSTLRTVYLPTANADTLLQKVQVLQTQLNEQRQYASERAAAFVQDRRRTEEAFANHRVNYEQQIEASGHKIQRLEEMLRNCTRDYIHMRRAKQANEERAVVAESALEELKMTVDERIREIKDSASAQLDKIRKTTQNTVDTYCNKFRVQVLSHRSQALLSTIQVSAKDDEIFNLEQILNSVKEDYERRTTELEEKSSRLSAKNKQLETRRSLDKEGFVSEISLLRKKLEVIDRRLHQMRLVERLGEDDRLDKMLQDLENKMPDLGPDDVYLKTCSISDVTSESSVMSSSSNPQPAESQLVLPNTLDATYQSYRRETDLREPYRVPDEILRGTKNSVEYDVSESPLIAFINARSGGRMGRELVESLFRALGNPQVYDVLEDRPDKVLRRIWENLEDMEKSGNPRAQEIKKKFKIAACGGDGTVAWVMKVIKDLELDPPPAIAIVPLGTGNDLSRTFKWGSTFEKKWIKNAKAQYGHLKEISDGVYRNLDCWNVTLTASTKGYFADLPHSLKPINDGEVVAAGCAWNYISFGMDAQSAYGFHHLRENHPALAFGRLINQFWYSFYGLQSGWFCCCNSLNPPVNKRLKLRVLSSSNEWTEVNLPNNIKALVVVNLQSYAGGRNIWGKGKLSKKEKEKGMSEPKIDDGLFEVVGFRTGWHTGFVMVGMSHCVRLAQGKAAQIKLNCNRDDPAGERDFIYMQIDGEPWKQRIPTSVQDQLTVEVSYNGFSSLLMNRKKMKDADFTGQSTNHESGEEQGNRGTSSAPAPSQ